MRQNLVDPIDDSSTSGDSDDNVKEEADAPIEVRAADLGVAARIDFDSQASDSGKVKD